jgi:hypothetical protein
VLTVLACKNAETAGSNAIPLLIITAIRYNVMAGPRAWCEVVSTYPTAGVLTLNLPLLESERISKEYKEMIREPDTANLPSACPYWRSTVSVPILQIYCQHADIADLPSACRYYRSTISMPILQIYRQHADTADLPSAYRYCRSTVSMPV